MSTVPLSPPPRRRAGRRSAVESDEALERLRRHLLSPQLQRLATLEGFADHLPSAIAASGRRGDSLAEALRPTIVASIRDAVRREPDPFVEAIVPAMGPVIRKTITHALRSAVQQLNETLARALSVEGLRWRWEAARTGRPFAEVVLLRSLVYRVEQVFLIHAETGIVLRHVVAAGVPLEDPDQVAAMLSAIDAFVHDAFREEARLGRFQVGELAGWVEHGSKTVLVALVRGTAPDSYGDVIREAHERIHVELRDELASFDNDVAPFSRAEPLLEACLRTETAPSVAAASTRRRWIGPALLVACLVGVIVYVALRLHASSVESARFAHFIEALRSEPGYVVTSAVDDRGRYVVDGLRDPLAASAEDVLARERVQPRAATLRFTPFYSLDPRLGARRAQQLLRPPPSVTLEAVGDVLRANGAAPREWIDRARLLAATLPGVTRFDTDRLVDADASARERLAVVPLLFEVDSVDPNEVGALDEAASLVREMLASPRLRFDVVGHADAYGSEQHNEKLSVERAERVVRELTQRGIPASRLDARGAGAREVPASETCDAGRAHGAACARRVEIVPVQP